MKSYLSSLSYLYLSLPENPILLSSTSELEDAKCQYIKKSFKNTERSKKIWSWVHNNIEFTATDVSNKPRPQCVVCFEIMSNQSMKQLLLKRYLTITKNWTLENKPIDYFFWKLTKMKSTKEMISSFSSSTKKKRDHLYWWA